MNVTVQEGASAEQEVAGAEPEDREDVGALPHRDYTATSRQLVQQGIQDR